MIVVLGENIIDLIETKAEHYSAALGGSPFNFAVGAAKQEVPCLYVTPISTDIYGEKFITHLTKCGARYGFHRRSKKPSSLALIAVGDNDSPQYSLYRDGIADRDYEAVEVLNCIPEDVRFFHTGSLVLVPDELPKLINILAGIKSKKIKLSLDINIRVNAVNDLQGYYRGIKTIIPYFSYVKASDEDLEFLYPGLEPLAAAQEILNVMDDGLVALTKGPHGADLLTQHCHVTQPIVPIRTFQDTVGAGDTFYSNLIAYFFERKFDSMETKSIQCDLLLSALQYALTAATINVERIGCNPPTKEEVMARLS